MIQINLLSKEERLKGQILLTKEAADREALDRALSDFHTRPANLRNPESKKVKCHQCKTTMTLAEFRDHTHKFVKDKGPFNSIASIFKGKRRNPHFSKRKLQLVERVKQNMPTLPDDLNAEDLQFLVRETRTNSSRDLREERAAVKKIKRNQQKASRRRNRV